MFLADITLLSGVTFEESAIFEFVSDSEFDWNQETHHYVGDRYYHDTGHIWNARLSGVTPVASKMDYLYGGMIRWSFGEIEFEQKFFSDESAWPPPGQFLLDCYWADSDGSAKVFLFSGHARLVGIDNTIKYKLYEKAYNQKCLKEITFFNGEEAVLPRVFGFYAHFSPLQIPVDDPYTTLWHNGYVSGTLGADWLVYDDGVDVSSDCDDIGDYTFSRPTAFVGTPTISGTGEVEYLNDVLPWACRADNLSIEPNDDDIRAGLLYLGYYMDAQTDILDFVSEVCAWHSHCAVITDGTLYFIDMLVSIGAFGSALASRDYISCGLTGASTYRKVLSSWNTYEHRETAEEGHHIATVPHEIERETPFGFMESDLTVTSYAQEESDAIAALENIRDTVIKAPLEISIPLTAIPNHGENIEWVDSTKRTDLNFDSFIREVRLNFRNKELTISGEGSIS
ncbi:MAG: hypothetical protein GY757_18825 [bacterium]|nr:hypothetical protein [bacterium]